MEPVLVLDTEQNGLMVRLTSVDEIAEMGDIVVTLQNIWKLMKLHVICK